MAIERIVDTSQPIEDEDESLIEVTLRPHSFEEYVGQDRLKKNLRLAIDAAKNEPSRSTTFCCMVHPGLVRQPWRW